MDAMKKAVSLLLPSLAAGQAQRILHHVRLGFQLQ